MNFSFINTLLIIIVISLLFGIFAVLVIYKQAFSYWKKRHVYTWTPKIPYGNAKDVIRQKKQMGFDIIELYNDLKSKSLRYGGYYMFLTPVFMPVDLHLVKRILTSDFDYFCDRISYANEEYDPLSMNLLHVHRERWTIIRSIMRPYFTSKKLNLAFPLLKEHTDNLTKLIDKMIKKEDFLDLKDILNRYTIDAVGMYFLNLNCNVLNSSDLTLKNQIEHFFNSSVIDSLIRLLISVPSVIKFFKIKTFNTKVTKFFTTFVESLLIDRKSQQQKPDDVLTVFASEDTPLRKPEIVANVAVSLFLGGYESTSNSISFTLYELSLNKKIQHAVREEIKSVRNKHGGLTVSALTDLVFLEQCIKETLRMHPASTLVTRICRKDYCVPDSDLVLKKGTHVYIPIRAIHYDPEIYSNPETFDPERFFQDNNLAPSSITWMPFSNGPRQCLGYTFGVFIVKLALIILLEKYEFSLHPSSDYPIQYDPNGYILQPLTPIRFIIKEIKKFDII